MRTNQTPQNAEWNIKVWDSLGLFFSVLVPLHQHLGPGCILAHVNPAWDACIVFVFGCQKTPSPKALKVRGVFHATTHDPVLGDNATTDSTGHEAKGLCLDRSNDPTCGRSG